MLYQFLIICGLLVANICISIFHGLRLKKRARNEMAALENRLKTNAAIKKSLAPSYEERLAAEYKKRGISG